MSGKVGFNKGKKFTEKHRERLRESHRGQISWNAGKKTGHLSEEHKEKLRRHRHSEETKELIRKKMVGRKITWIDRMTGKKRSEETRKNISNAKRGQKNPQWKGGIQIDVTKSPKYKDWAKSIKKRDAYKCQDCGVSRVPLHAHHIKPKFIYPELMFESENGITLCVPCHKERHYKMRTKKP